MGGYDTVHFKCPKCKNKVSLQSKAGDCRLLDIPARAVPADVAKAISDRELNCNRCNAHLVIKPITPINTIAMELVEWTPEPIDEDEEP